VTGRRTDRQTELLYQSYALHSCVMLTLRPEYTENKSSVGQVMNNSVVTPFSTHTLVNGPFLRLPVQYTMWSSQILMKTKTAEQRSGQIALLIKVLLLLGFLSYKSHENQAGESTTWLECEVFHLNDVRLMTASSQVTLSFVIHRYSAAARSRAAPRRTYIADWLSSVPPSRQVQHGSRRQRRWRTGLAAAAATAAAAADGNRASPPPPPPLSVLPSSAPSPSSSHDRYLVVGLPAAFGPFRWLVFSSSEFPPVPSLKFNYSENEGWNTLANARKRAPKMQDWIIQDRTTTNRKRYVLNSSSLQDMCYLWQPCVADADIIFLPCSFFLSFYLSFLFLA